VGRDPRFKAVLVRFEVDDLAGLQSAAKESDLNVSQVLRQLVRAYLAEQKVQT